MSAPASHELRMSLLSADQATGDAARVLASPVGSMTVFRMLAHAQANVLPVMKLGGAILSQQQLDARSRELMVLVALALEHGRYEWAHHVEIATGAGITEREIAAIERGDLVSGFNSRDRALLRFAEMVVKRPQLTDEVFAAARAHLGEREIVEAIVAIGFYMMLVRVTEGLGIGAEPPQGAALMTSLQSRKLE